MDNVVGNASWKLGRLYLRDSTTEIQTILEKSCLQEVEILKWDSSYDMRYELFNRLNTGGTPLTQQEIRNCIFRDISSKFNDFLHELAGNAEFKRTVLLSHEQNDCLFNEGLVLRFFALFDSGTHMDIQPGFAQYMTDYMKSGFTECNLRLCWA